MIMYHHVSFLQQEDCSQAHASKSRKTFPEASFFPLVMFFSLILLEKPTHSAARFCNICNLSYLTFTCITWGDIDVKCNFFYRNRKIISHKIVDHVLM